MVFYPRLTLSPSLTLTQPPRMKRLPPVAAVVTAGYAITAYREAQAAHHHEQAELERRRRNAAMADAYGERDSLEELERAVRVYELAQQQQQQGR